MTKSLKGTQTARNLITAFVGESVARNKYDFFSKVAKSNGYEQIARIFTETANNEKAHSKVFYKFLAKEELAPIRCELEFVETLGSTIKNLQAAVDGEHYENTILYPKFAEVAKEEGFDELYEIFHSIVKVEKHHEFRYKKLLENLEMDKVFKRDKENDWICLNCGYIENDMKAPSECPACHHPQAYFELLCDNF